MLRAVAAVFVLLLIVVHVPAPVRAGVPPPQWTVGDYWEYTVRTAVEQGLVLNGTVRATIRELGPILVKNTTWTAYRTLLGGSGDVQNAGSGPRVHGRWTIAGEQWVESGNFKVVRAVSQVDGNGTADPFRVPFSFQVQNTTENAVLNDTWRYPLEVGTSGALVTNTTSRERLWFRLGFTTNESTSGGTYRRTLRLSVENASRVSAPAGTFDTLEVRIGWPSGDTDVWYYSAAVGNNVRTETRNRTGATLAESTLRAYRYHAAEPPAGLLSPEATVGLIGGATAAAIAAAVLLVRRRRKGGRAAGEPGPSGPT